MHDAARHQEKGETRRPLHCSRACRKSYSGILLLHSGLEHVLAGNHYCFNLGPNASLCIPSRHVSIGHEAASQGGRVWPDLVVFLSRLAVPTAWSPQSCHQQDRPEKSAEDRHLRRTTRGGSRHPKSHMLPVPGRPPAEFSHSYIAREAYEQFAVSVTCKCGKLGRKAAKVNPLRSKALRVHHKVPSCDKQTRPLRGTLECQVMLLKSDFEIYRITADGDRATVARMTNLALDDCQGPPSPVGLNPRPWYHYPPFRLFFHFGSYLNLSYPSQFAGAYRLFETHLSLHGFPSDAASDALNTACLEAPWKSARSNATSRQYGVKIVLYLLDNAPMEKRNRV
ncbi:hypothetical protein J3E68DRAFT_439456 [Trichoderma sp. SZMC 28012]